MLGIFILTIYTLKLSPKCKGKSFLLADKEPKCACATKLVFH